TVILVGRRRAGSGRSETVLTVRSVQGEPAAPENPEEGFVWRAIVEQIDNPGSVSAWVSIDNLGRERYFGRQPWILTDGGLEMVEQLIESSAKYLGALSEAIGRTTHTGLDEAFYMTAPAAKSRSLDASCVPVVPGDGVRDFRAESLVVSFFPYDREGKPRELVRREVEFLWPNRSVLRRRIDFGQTPEGRGLRWFDHSMFFPQRFRSPLSIAFPFVATHGHFALDRGGRLFNRTAPVIKLPEGASEEEHLRLLGLLNSSTACFWLKMVSYPKGGDPMGDSGARVSVHPWSDRYEFTGGNLQDFPLPATFPTTLSAMIDRLAQELAAYGPAAVCAHSLPTASALRTGYEGWKTARMQMISAQEELDWQVYSIYGLAPENLHLPEGAELPAIQFGERAFEIVLARRIANGEASEEWITRHGTTPITELPSHWPAAYREIVERRIETIESNRAIGMIERPEYKRRWATEGWDAMQEKALRAWLLDRMESRDLWFDDNNQPQILTLSRLTD